MHLSLLARYSSKDLNATHHLFEKTRWKGIEDATRGDSLLIHLRRKSDLSENLK